MERNNGIEWNGGRKPAFSVLRQKKYHFAG